MMRIPEKDIADFKSIISRQQAFFDSGITQSLVFRLESLRKLYQAIQRYESDLLKAVYEDFGKPEFETYGTEIALTLKEIRFFLKQLPSLIRPKKVKTPAVVFPGKSYIYYEPYGLSLIIGPWNYPIMLLLHPFVGSIAAGNCVVLKPSELTSKTSDLVKKLIEETFPEEYVAVVQGGPEETTKLLEHRFDHIFFTGSTKVGKLVYKAAAQHLTPVVLELGGKSPCIVDRDTNIDETARRIVFGKLLNAGQTCVAPDYLLVHQAIKKPLLDKICHYIDLHYRGDPHKSPDLARIINDRNFRRIASYLASGKIVYGGEINADDRYIAPTIIDNVTWDDQIMQDEIFGPLLPVMTFDNLQDVIHELKNRSKPLALYYFSRNRKNQERVLKELSFGGGCINDTLLQFGSSHLPIGGIGLSGIGKYHGKHSFLTFSNQKGIVKKRFIPEIPFRYPPYAGKMGLLRAIFKL